MLDVGRTIFLPIDVINKINSFSSFTLSTLFARTAYSLVKPQLKRDLETKNKANFSHRNTFRTEVQKYNIYHFDELY